MDFNKLSSLQRDINSWLRLQDRSIRHYQLRNGIGFSHVYEAEETKEDFSKSSTATCILSLTSTGHWTEDQHWWHQHTKELLNELMRPASWESAGLKLYNPFTLAFMIEAGHALGKVLPEIFQQSKYQRWKSLGVSFLVNSLLKKDPEDEFSVVGAANIEKYPPTTYLTQLVVRVLAKNNELTPNIREKVSQWAWQEVMKELALKAGNSKNADILSLAYGLITISICSRGSEATPDQNQLLRQAMRSIFASQLQDGTWPRSRPLFHYPKFGNAYCFEYEMLAQMLQQKDLRTLALDFMPELNLSVDNLKETVFRFEDGGVGWASGHHPQLAGPESWSTASVFHFLYELDRTLAESIRQELFAYVDAEYPTTSYSKDLPESFAPKLLDSRIVLEGKNESLKKILAEQFLNKVRANLKNIETGRSLPIKVPVSAVLFGPPGTAKTRLAQEIANYLSWPLLSINPSHLVRKGLDQIQAETNRLFSMLTLTEQVVVLLDEFDEMVRERMHAQSEVISRFLTTAMLPNLTLINERRKILFIVATNHIDQFDFAIRRPGRFDLILQVMPPELESKLDRWPKLREKLAELGINYKHDPNINKEFSALTFTEFESLVPKILSARTPDRVEKVTKDAFEHSTLNEKASGQEDSTWLELSKKQEDYIRVLG